MSIDLLVLTLLAASAAGALLCRRNDKLASCLGGGGGVLALLIKLVGLFSGSLLSGCFQLPICLVGIAAACHSPGYMSDHGKKRMSLYWFCFDLTLLAMLAVTMLGKGFTFLVAWEVMGLASFALVAFDWRKENVRQAAWIYLLACEAGGLLLIWSLTAGQAAPPAVLAALIVIAFGLKAGFPLLHVWLPEAHPAAPAPVSALMSAAMIPLGFYGIISWVPEVMNAVAAGWVFFFLGAIGMLGGIMFGAAQSDLKRLLAYSSVENIGIITLALALGILGSSINNSIITLFAFTGGMLHLINHALLKSTLFLGAGSVYKSMHTLDMDVMGGLSRKLPCTGLMFTLSSLGISGLPPFCGFTGELLIYMAAFCGIATASGGIFAVCVATVVLLALTGGMAAAAFSKTVSAVFAGEPRSQAAENAATESNSMVLAQLITGVPALAMTLAAPWLAAGVLSSLWEEDPARQMLLFPPLFYNSLFAVALVLLTGVLLFIRWKMLNRSRAAGPTWDCGFAAPTGRMQYTATAFIQPLADLFNEILQQKKSLQKPQGLFPEHAELSVETPDGLGRLVWKPVFGFFSAVSDKVRHLQSGFLHVYILIMVLAIMLMLLGCFLTGSKSDSKRAAAAVNMEQVNHE
ncbi:MAG: hypothetical protein E7052_04080 [Lentisphaerae bacterium]|nr:hypothetical protein [Lentisphaerota bacterium]